MDKPLAASRGARSSGGSPQRSPHRQRKGGSPSKSHLRSAAHAANALIHTAEAGKDRKNALAAAARLFDLAASDPHTKVEFVDANGDALSEASSEGAPPFTSGEQFLEDAMRARGYAAEDATAAAWAAFWRSAPDVVAIDAEGTQHSPPLLVQIAADSRRTVLLEAPGGRASDDLRRLLGDASITKCFFGPPDRERLGARIANGVDVQASASAALAGGRGRGGASRSPQQKGLAAACGELCRGEPFSKHKDLQKSFGLVRERPGGLEWLSDDQRKYAAADAWATLEIHRALARAPPPPDPSAKRRRNRSASRGPKRRKGPGGGAAAVEIEINFA